MRRDAMATVGAWMMVMTGAALLGWAVVGQPGRAVSVRERPAAATSPFPASTRYAAESLGGIVVTQDVFRSDRRPADAVYDPARGASPPATAPIKPALILTGIVWGPLREAVIEGLPGTDGPRVVRASDVVAGLTVKRIEAGQVVITGMDTTWTLKVREPWR